MDNVLMQQKSIVINIDIFVNSTKMLSKYLN
jgi:hypothetical protein